MRDWLEDTIIYGEDNALPLRIAKAVDESPAATACIDTIAQFTKGAGFTIKKLERQIINKSGETLWQHHCKLADIISMFNGFAVNLKFNLDEQITNAFELSFESVRFVKPKEELSSRIDWVKYNPYYGTAEFKQAYSKAYPVYNKERLKEQMNELGNTFPGQVYYFGKTSPLYRFYPVPKYWSAQKWIYVDGKIQEFHQSNLDNGFFQSVLMNVIGDPNAWSSNPRLQEKYTKEDGTEGYRPTKTVGEEFNDMMQGNFSGSQKAGNVMALWALNSDQAVKLQPFPNNTNADLFTTLQDITTKNITIATKVPSILANISEGVALGSGGSEIQKAIELMQSRVVEWQMALMEYYNEVLLPGMGIEERVEIINFNPISETPQIDDKVWEFLNEVEKVEWIRSAYPNINIQRAPMATPVIAPTTADGQPAPITPPPSGNSALKELKIADLNKIQKIVARFNLSQTDPSNPKSLTFDQAKQILAGYGFTDEEINAWLVTPDELND